MVTASENKNIMSITLVQAEDQAIVLEGVTRLLEDIPQFRVVGKAYNGLEALKLCLSLSPKLLILDLMLPDITGVQVAKRLQEAGSQTKIIILSGSDSPGQIEQCFKSGAHGYVIKSSPFQTLRTAIDTVLSGEIFVDPSLRGFMANLQLLQTPVLIEQCSYADGEKPNLTPKELEVLQMLSLGSGKSKEVAEKLSISLHTVNKHVASILSKLSAATRTEAVQKARSLKLV